LNKCKRSAPDFFDQLLVANRRARVLETKLLPLQSLGAEANRNDNGQPITGIDWFDDCAFTA